jgi:CcmD family protein
MKKIIFSVFILMSAAAALAQPGQSEFAPVTDFPAAEQLPAAPLVIAAYAFVWAAVVAYVWVMWRKLGKVEQELGALSAQLAKKRP